MAFSKAASALSRRPWSFSTVPRLLWTPAIPGIEENPPPICRLGGIQFMPLVQHSPEIELGLGVGRPQRDGVAIRRCRLVEPALHLQQHPDVVVVFGVIASRLAGGSIGFHCFVEVALLPEGVAESEKG